MTRVKICGLSRPEDIDAVNAEKPDYIGFVFAPSRRRVTPEQASDLRRKLAPGITPVGVFVDEEPGNILALARRGLIEAIQLHGSEDEEYIRRLKAAAGMPVIKAAALSEEGGARQWADTAADFLLFDSRGGGTGRSFDWNLIGIVEKPFFLAGGLNPENVALALERVGPFAADVSSGVETGGVKDRAKIRAFIERVRNG